MGIASTMVIVYIVKGIGYTMVVIVYIVIGYSMVIVYMTRERRTLEGIGLSFWRLVANACMRMSSSHWPMPVPLPAAAAWQRTISV